VPEFILFFCLIICGRLTWLLIRSVSQFAIKSLHIVSCAFELLTKSVHTDYDQIYKVLWQCSRCSSLVLRDLTLRSASSFGAFHLIRLLFDEYLFYMVEHKVAAATGVSIIAAFGNIKQVGMATSHLC